MNEERIKIFEVFGKNPTYLVRVNNDVYEMNEHCNLPNGVNMYVGTWDEWKEHCKSQKKLRFIPIVLIYGWISRSNIVEVTE